MTDRFRAAVSMVHSPDVANMALWARAVVLAEGNHGMVKSLVQDMPSAVQKAANAPLFTSDSDMTGLVNTQAILTSFYPFLRNRSCLFRLLSDNLMIKLPLRMRVSFTTGAVQMDRVGEADAIAVSRMVSDKVFIDPQKAIGIIIFSKEMVQFLSSAGEAFLSLELSRAISAAADAAFFEIINDGSTPTRVSVGTSPESAISDMKFLLDETQLTAESKPLFVMAPDVARRLATMYYTTGLVFRDMGPMGGTLLNVPAMVCDAMADGTLGLIDGAGIAGDAEGVKITTSKEGLVQLNDAPDSPATASTTMVNLWQSNLVGLRPEIYFGASRLRASAFSIVTGIHYGSNDSPPV